MLARLALVASLLTLTSAFASAQSPIDIAWNDCAGSVGAQDLITSACNSNAGSQVMVASFRAPFALDALVGTTTTIDVFSSSPVMPDWWRGETGGCRAGAFTSIDPANTAGAFGCNNPFAASALFAGLVVVKPNQFGQAYRTRLIVDAVGSDPSPPIPAETWAVAGALEIRNVRTTGAGTCGGCSEIVCALIQRVDLYQVTGTLPYDTWPLDNSYNPEYVHWQGICIPVPTRSTTWGKVKATYR